MGVGELRAVRASAVRKKGPTLKTQPTPTAATHTQLAWSTFTIFCIPGRPSRAPACTRMGNTLLLTPPFLEGPDDGGDGVDADDAAAA